MPRFVNFITGVALTAAASATVNCDAAGCSSCVGSGVATVCANYSAPPPPPSCLPSCGGTACSTNTACTGTTCNATCNTCVRVSSILGACVTATFGTSLLLHSQSSLDAGFNLGLFNSPPEVTITSTTTGVIAGNAIVTLDGTATIATLQVGDGFTSGTMFQVKSAVTVANWTNYAGQAKVDNNCAAITVNTLTLGGSSFAVFQSCPQAMVTLPAINFTARGMFSGTAKLHIAGGMAHIGTTNGASVTGTGTLQLSGGVSIDGNIPKDVTISVATAGKSAPLAAVEVSTTLSTFGNVEGTSGTIVVNGTFILGSASATLEPRVVIQEGGSLVINSATALQAKAVEVSARATLVISVNAAKAVPYIEKIAKCAGVVRIKLDTTASAFVSGTSAGAAVGLTYSSNNIPADLKNCVVEIVDSAGVSTTLTSTTTASVGRRLLAETGTANWGSSSMDYKMPPSAASSSFACIPIVAVVMMGFLA